jgi:hypothetical protein
MVTNPCKTCGVDRDETGRHLWPETPSPDPADALLYSMPPVSAREVVEYMAKANGIDPAEALARYDEPYHDRHSPGYRWDCETCNPLVPRQTLDEWLGIPAMPYSFRQPDGTVVHGIAKRPHNACARCVSKGIWYSAPLDNTFCALHWAHLTRSEKGL